MGEVELVAALISFLPCETGSGFREIGDGRRCRDRWFTPTAPDVRSAVLGLPHVGAIAAQNLFSGKKV